MSSPAQNQTEAGAPDAPTSARLLVVDDEESVALTLGEVLRLEGFEVDTASSGSEAAGLLGRAQYDLVLTDLHMEDGDGISVLEEVRRRSPLTISIVLTGFARLENAILALRHGAYDYLVKPCIIDELKHTVRRGLEHRRLMLAEAEARRALEELNRDLERRVEERTAELVHLNEELSEANRAKDVFLATLSHELRTPLTPVLGWVNLLRSGGASANSDPALVSQALEAIERNARLQARLIDDLLDISRIVSGKLRLEWEPIDLSMIAKAAAETVRATASAKSITLDLRLPEEPVVVYGEQVRLQQIVWNLLSNAVKFTPPGGRVTLDLGRESGEARLVVEDTGAGITPEFLPHVFDRFRQADGSTTRQHGGLGLGLAIVRALTDLHGGWVRAESDGLGAGARFTLGLPCAIAEDAREETAGVVTMPKIARPVLVVDDSPETLELMHTLFSRKGYAVMTAESAAEALRLAGERTPGVIISDISMPERDGYALLAELRRMPGCERVPAIALSGYAMEEDRDQALAAGFDVHLAKPVDPDKLFATIQSLTA
ncbi:MAG TPA: response regulator [Pyrinomonadaceae bacterium]|nr:response regulator [Pyrinomonadaceae bacterium]